MKTKAALARREDRIKAIREVEQWMRRTKRAASNDVTLSDVIERPQSKKFPDPWHVDSGFMIQELDRLRELAWHIPFPRNEQILPVQTLVDGLWQLREQIRELLGIHIAMQRDWKARANGEKPAKAASQPKRHLPANSPHHPQRHAVSA